jgi:transcriptional regulator with XRE-family HTH domain
MKGKIFMDIKDRIKEVRIAVGISQVSFAKRIAVAASYISEIEGGAREANERAIRLIIAEFNVNENWLRRGQGAMFAEDVSAAVSEAIGLFKSLDRDFQDSAIKILAELSALNKKRLCG